MGADGTELLTGLSGLAPLLEGVIDENVLLIDEVGRVLVDVDFFHWHTRNKYFIQHVLLAIADADVAGVLGQHAVGALLLIAGTVLELVAQPLQVL